MKLTRAERQAIDTIGRRRKRGAKVGPGGVSKRMFNQLAKKGLVMSLNNGKECMLTYPGERVYTQLHPHSKYRIN